MPRSPSLDHFLSLDELVGEDDGPEGLAAYASSDSLLDWGADDFIDGIRSFVSEINDFSRAQMPLRHEGLRIVEFDSETDTEDQIAAIAGSSLGCDSDLPFFWECLHVEEERNDPIEDFEWEDVSARIDMDNPNPDMWEGDDSERNVEWEVLLNLNRNDGESDFAEDREGFTHTSEYEVLFDQFGVNGLSDWMKRGRPAAKSVIESLPLVLLTEEDVSKKNSHCAVCKDEISLSEEVKRLPCLHYYHECCIVPWLSMRNTCPLCRHELPTSDIVISEEGEAQTRFEFEILQAT